MSSVLDLVTMRGSATLSLTRDLQTARALSFRGQLKSRRNTTAPNHPVRIASITVATP